MAYDNAVTIIGNLTRNPELRYTAAGTAVASFGIAWNRKDKDGSEVVSFFDVTCWRDLAEHVAESLTKGNRAVVFGRIEQDTWTTDDGEKRSKVKVVADDVAASMRWSPVSVVRDARGQQQPKFAAGQEPF